MSTHSRTARLVRESAPPGFGLVELMIALAIGVFLIAGSVVIYAKAREVRSALDANARIQEIARYAMSIIEADVRMAGYWGLTARADSVTANASLAFPDKCGGIAWITQTASYLDGTNNSYLPATNCAAAYGGAQPGADVLVVRRASAQRIAPQRPTIAAPDRERVLVITSHSDGQIFLPATIGNQVPAGYATADAAGQAPQADTRALLVDAYYVSTGSSVNPGYPALRRKMLAAGPDVADEEVIAGVEDLQFQVGLDTNGDRDADVFMDPGWEISGARPVSVRIWLRVRALERDPTLGSQALEAYADRSPGIAADFHRRLLVSKTIRLRDVPP
jgi:type IV pilus assembly protein PilW